MLNDPVWVVVGQVSPWVQIHKTSGKLSWNVRAHQMLGLPESVCLFHDTANHRLCVKVGYDFAVKTDDDGLLHIDAKDALIECGLVFPLEENYEAQPVLEINGGNQMVFPL